MRCCLDWNSATYLDLKLIISLMYAWYSVILAIFSYSTVCSKQCKFAFYLMFSAKTVYLTLSRSYETLLMVYKNIFFFDMINFCDLPQILIAPGLLPGINISYGLPYSLISDICGATLCPNTSPMITRGSYIR